MQFCHCGFSNSYCSCFSNYCSDFSSPYISPYYHHCKPCCCTHVIEKIHCPCPHPKKDECKPVCNKTCGNLLLSEAEPNQSIWRESLSSRPTVTISVFNNSTSLSSILVRVTRNESAPVEFTVPPGNTVSETFENAHEIMVFRQGAGITEGRYCLEVCIPFICHDRRRL